MSEHVSELRKQHPNAGSGFFDLMEERRELQDRLSEVRGRIAFLVGFHGRDGAVPIEALEKVLAGEAVGES